MSGFVRIHVGVLVLLGIFSLSVGGLGATLVEDRDDPWGLIIFAGNALWWGALIYLGLVEGVVA